MSRTALGEDLTVRPMFITTLSTGATRIVVKHRPHPRGKIQREDAKQATTGAGCDDEFIEKNDEKEMFHPLANATTGSVHSTGGCINKGGNLSYQTSVEQTLVAVSPRTTVRGPTAADVCLPMEYAYWDQTHTNLDSDLADPASLEGNDQNLYSVDEKTALRGINEFTFHVGCYSPDKQLGEKGFRRQNGHDVSFGAEDIIGDKPASVERNGMDERDGEKAVPKCRTVHDTRDILNIPEWNDNNGRTLQRQTSETTEVERMPSGETTDMGTRETSYKNPSSKTQGGFLYDSHNWIGPEVSECRIPSSIPDRDIPYSVGAQEPLSSEENSTSDSIFSGQTGITFTSVPEDGLRSRPTLGTDVNIHVPLFFPPLRGRQRCVSSRQKRIFTSSSSSEDELKRRSASMLRHPQGVRKTLRANNDNKKISRQLNNELSSKRTDMMRPTEDYAETRTQTNSALPSQRTGADYRSSILHEQQNPEINVPPFKKQGKISKPSKTRKDSQQEHIQQNSEDSKQDAQQGIQCNSLNSCTRGIDAHEPTQLQGLMSIYASCSPVKTLKRMAEHLDQNSPWILRKRSPERTKEVFPEIQAVQSSVSTHGGRQNCPAGLRQTFEMSQTKTSAATQVSALAGLQERAPSLGLPEEAETSFWENHRNPCTGPGVQFHLNPRHDLEKNNNIDLDPLRSDLDSIHIDLGPFRWVETALSSSELTSTDSQRSSHTTSSRNSETETSSSTADSVNTAYYLSNCENSGRVLSAKGSFISGKPASSRNDGSIVRGVTVDRMRAGADGEKTLGGAREPTSALTWAPQNHYPALQISLAKSTQDEHRQSRESVCVSSMRGSGIIFSSVCRLDGSHGFEIHGFHLDDKQNEGSFGSHGSHLDDKQNEGSFESHGCHLDNKQNKRFQNHEFSIDGTLTEGSESSYKSHGFHFEDKQNEGSCKDHGFQFNDKQNEGSNETDSPAQDSFVHKGESAAISSADVSLSKTQDITKLKLLQCLSRASSSSCSGHHLDFDIERKSVVSRSSSNGFFTSESEVGPLVTFPRAWGRRFLPRRGSDDHELDPFCNGLELGPFLNDLEFGSFCNDLDDHDVGIELRRRYNSFEYLPSSPFARPVQRHGSNLSEGSRPLFLQRHARAGSVRQLSMDIGEEWESVNSPRSPPAVSPTSPGGAYDNVFFPSTSAGPGTSLAAEYKGSVLSRRQTVKRRSHQTSAKLRLLYPKAGENPLVTVGKDELQRILATLTESEVHLLLRRHSPLIKLLQKSHSDYVNDVDHDVFFAEGPAPVHQQRRRHYRHDVLLERDHVCRSEQVQCVEKQRPRSAKLQQSRSEEATIPQGKRLKRHQPTDDPNTGGEVFASSSGEEEAAQQRRNNPEAVQRQTRHGDLRDLVNKGSKAHDDRSGPAHGCARTRHCGRRGPENVSILGEDQGDGGHVASSEEDAGTRYDCVMTLQQKGRQLRYRPEGVSPLSISQQNENKHDENGQNENEQNEDEQKENKQSENEQNEDEKYADRRNKEGPSENQQNENSIQKHGKHVFSDTKHHPKGHPLQSDRNERDQGMRYTQEHGHHEERHSGEPSDKEIPDKSTGYLPRSSPLRSRPVVTVQPTQRSESAARMAQDSVSSLNQIEQNRELGRELLDGDTGRPSRPVTSAANSSPADKTTSALQEDVDTTGRRQLLRNPYNRINQRFHSTLQCPCCFFPCFLCCAPAVYFMGKSDHEFDYGSLRKARVYGRKTTVLYVVGAAVGGCLLVAAVVATFIYLQEVLTDDRRWK